MKKILTLTLLLLMITIVAKAQVEIVSTESGGTYYVTVPGAFVLTLGLQVTFKANVANSASQSLNVSGSGPISIRKEGGATALTGGDIKTGQIVTVAYDGTNWQMISAVGSTPTAPTNYWSPSGSDIYSNNAGNVGIGTSTPASGSMLHIHKGGITNPYIRFTDGTTGSTSTDGLIVGTNGAGQSYIVNNETTTDLHIGNAVDNNLITVKGNANYVGIGTSTPTAKLDVNGTIVISGANTNELNRAQTGAANLVPIAYGNIAGNATINATTGNFTVVWNGANLWYEITITGEAYNNTNYIATITPIAGVQVTTATSTLGGKLLVVFNDLGGTKIQQAFQFLVYKP